MNELLLSIIIPVYHSEKYLPACIDSLLSQTYGNLEIILVDDGSPDNCSVICDNYVAQDSRIKVIHKQNAGVAAARNSGLDIATGDYITFVDSDDYIDSCMYEKMMEKAVQYNCDFVMCDCMKEFPDRSEIYTHNIREGFYNYDQLMKEYYPHLLVMPNIEYPATISNWLCLFRHSNSEFIRYVEGVRYSEDWLFGCQVMLQSRSFYYMKGEAYYHYRMNESSATHKFVPDKWIDYQKLYHHMEEVFLTAPDYDFREQLDKVLLFLVYNAVGDLLGASELLSKDKYQRIKAILKSSYVREMFKRVSIFQLPVSYKLKLKTVMYKYKIGLRLFNS